MYRIFFNADNHGGALTDLQLSSDVKMDRVLPGGTTAHADWFGAWHPGAMDMFYAAGYKAPATELVKLCPGKSFNAENPLLSVAMCRMH